MSDTTVQINENLVKMDNVLTGLEYILEEVENRKNNVFNGIDMNRLIQDEINGDRFRERLAEYVTEGYSSGIYREVAFRVMEQIDNDIAAFINARVDERLQELGVVPSHRV